MQLVCTYQGVSVKKYLVRNSFTIGGGVAKVVLVCCCYSTVGGGAVGCCYCVGGCG